MTPTQHEGKVRLSQVAVLGARYMLGALELEFT